MMAIVFLAISMIVIAIGAPILGMLLMGRRHAPPSKDFQTLLRWEHDGIFPRIYGGGSGPAWYEEEKLRRGIIVKPTRIVTPEEFHAR